MTISTTGTPERPATDLGYLLHKHPDKAQTFSTSHGTAHVFYPEASVERCTAALLLEVDPVALVRRGKGKGRGGAPDAALAQYVNDRPYAASSLLSVAMTTVFKSALNGACRAMPERAAEPLPLRIEVPALPARGGAELVHKLFAPLGWSRVDAVAVPLDEQFPEWGDSRYVRLVLEGELRLADALRQLYVLLPVLDDAKHYWVAPDEVDKLLRAGEGWLAYHPEQKLITSRYLSRRWGLTRQAMERLELVRLAESDDLEVESVDNAVDETTDTEEKPVPLAEQRREAILEALRSAGAARVLDLGCGQGQLVQALLRDVRYTEIVGVDVSMRALTVAAQPAEAGPDGRAAGRPGRPPPGRAHLHRQAAQGIRRRRAQRGDRAPRPGAAARPGVRGVRLRATAHRARDDAQRRVQRPLGDAPRRARTPRRPPLRVDQGGIPGLGGAGGGAPRIHGGVRARGAR